MKKPHIVVISTGATEETQDLLRAAQEMGVRLSVTDRTVPTDADVVYWRSSPISRETFRSVGRFMMLADAHLRGIPVVNPALLHHGYYPYKSYQQWRVQRDLTTAQSVPTYTVSAKRGIEALLSRGTLTYPFIAKPNRGGQGTGVLLVSTVRDLVQIDRYTRFVFQPYIENTGEYRIFVIGGVARECYLKTPTSRSTHSFLNNVSAGADVVRVHDGALRGKLARLGEHVAALMNMAVCAVDVLQASDGKLYFLEVNSVPQWCMYAQEGGVDIGAEIVRTLAAIGARRERDIEKHIRTYYLDNLKHLSIKKQFHFLSRLFLWTGKKKYKKLLDTLRPHWQHNVEQLIAQAAAVPSMTPQAHKTGGRVYRTAAYRSYSKIYEYNNIFFHLLFTETVYGDGAYRDAVLAAIERADIDSLYEALHHDARAILTLSTHAVNFLYFYQYFFAAAHTDRYPEHLLHIADTVTLSDPYADTEARIYMLTHAIIGASRFYAAPMLPDRVRYVALVRRLERYITEHFVEVSLDQKCEFLVCTRLCGYASPLAAAITAEIQRSRSAYGPYIIDTHNAHAMKQALKNTLGHSEHRNVLALMALSDRG